MVRLRLAIKKEEALQFLGHLDFARAVARIVRRAKLPIAYSEGFNPHMKISYASALGVGVIAAVEYMDIELTEELPVLTVVQAMNAQAPQGFAVSDGAYVDMKAPKLMALCNYATYELRGPVTELLDQKKLDELLCRFNEAPSVLYQKNSPKNKRQIEVKKHLIEPLSGTIHGDEVEIRVGIYRTEEGAVKPVEVWQVLAGQFGLPVAPDGVLARRTGIYARQADNNKTPLEFKGV